MRRVGAGSGVGVVCAAALLALAACSDDKGGTAAGGGAGATTTTVAEMSAPIPPGGGLPIVEQIGPAIAALEAELGGPQQYFEINATSQLVNLFVALNDGAVVQAWVYLDGELSSSEGQPASGGTFAAADLDFDPALVLSKISSELPGSTLGSFYVNGDGEGNVKYGLLVTSDKGGGLDVAVGADGSVLSVDPVN